jgi:hypothetical protein
MTITTIHLGGDALDVLRIIHQPIMRIYPEPSTVDRHTSLDQVQKFGHTSIWVIYPSSEVFHWPLNNHVARNLTLFV